MPGQSRRQIFSQHQRNRSVTVNPSARPANWRTPTSSAASRSSTNENAAIAISAASVPKPSNRLQREATKCLHSRGSPLFEAVDSKVRGETPPLPAHRQQAIGRGRHTDSRGRIPFTRPLALFRAPLRATRSLFMPASPCTKGEPAGLKGPPFRRLGAGQLAHDQCA